MGFLLERVPLPVGALEGLRYLLWHSVSFPYNYFALLCLSTWALWPFGIWNSVFLLEADLAITTFVNINVSPIYVVLLFFCDSVCLHFL